MSIRGGGWLVLAAAETWRLRFSDELSLASKLKPGPRNVNLILKQITPL